MAAILVVDDEVHVTRVLRLALERAGYEVTVASDGEEALAALESGRFDALLTDITMPRMGGRELCEKARQRHGGEELPIFVMTSRAEDEFRTWTETLARVEFIEKPLSLRRLVTRLGACLAAAADSAETGT